MFPRHRGMDFFLEALRIPREFLERPAGRGLAHGIFRPGKLPARPGIPESTGDGERRDFYFFFPRFFHFQSAWNSVISREKPVWFLGVGGLMGRVALATTRMLFILFIIFWLFIILWQPQPQKCFLFSHSSRNWSC